MRLRPLTPILALAFSTLAACGGGGSEPAAPFAHLAGDYVLVAVRGAALPQQVSSATWVFDERMRVWGEGRFQKIATVCTPSGESCPQRTSVATGEISVNPGGLIYFGRMTEARRRPDGGLDLVEAGSDDGTALLQYERVGD